MLGGSPTDNNAILFRQGQMEIVQPYVDKGIIKIVADQWVDNWDAANANKIMENILTAQQNKIDAVVASNDGTALGALQAMKAQKLGGIVPISGQDATADGCNTIVKGELTVSILKDIRNLTPLAVDHGRQPAPGQARRRSEGLHHGRADQRPGQDRRRPGPVPARPAGQQRQRGRTRREVRLPEGRRCLPRCPGSCGRRRKWREDQGRPVLLGLRDRALEERSSS